MPGDWSKRFGVGEPWAPNAQKENLTTDVIRSFLAGGGRGVITGGTGTAGNQPDGLILIQNNSGANRAVGEILGIDNILFTPTQNMNSFLFSPALKGIVPTVAAHTGKFVVCAQPIASGALGQAYIFGVCAAFVNFGNGFERAADVTDSDATKLAAGTGSAQILWNPGTTGKQLAIVRLGGQKSIVLVKSGTPTSNTGEYNGWIMTGNATGMPPSGMTVGPACLIENYPDSSLSGVWPIPASSYIPGVVIGMNGSGTPIVAVYATAPENCS
jgi:hypothetical protein